MESIMITQNDEIVMRLLHYFIVEKGYNPIVLHGAKDEIWLENMDGNYQIIRIVTGYIHNDEQLSYDLMKTTQIMKQIKKKTFSFSMQALSLFLNLGENVHDFEQFPNIACAKVEEYNDLSKNQLILEEFPDITKQFKDRESGLALFAKIMGDINQKNKDEAEKAEEVFSPKKPVVTYILILINVLVFLGLLIYNNFSITGNLLYQFGALTNDTLKNHEWFRFLSAIFLHAGFAHLICNMYSLYVIGPQIESFFGKWKYLFIYLFSGFAGGLMSALFLPEHTVGVGASGAIFGLLGSLVYFGYHYRAYLGSVMKSQIIPLILINLVLGFMVSGIDVSAHIGGLIGGFLITMAVGVKYKSKKEDQINGIIMTIIFTGFLLFLGLGGLR